MANDEELNASQNFYEQKLWLEDYFAASFIIEASSYCMKSLLGIAKLNATSTTKYTKYRSVSNIIQ